MPIIQPITMWHGVLNSFQEELGWILPTTFNQCIPRLSIYQFFTRPSSLSLRVGQTMAELTQWSGLTWHCHPFIDLKGTLPMPSHEMAGLIKGLFVVSQPVPWIWFGGFNSKWPMSPSTPPAWWCLSWTGWSRRIGNGHVGWNVSLCP